MATKTFSVCPQCENDSLSTRRSFTEGKGAIKVDSSCFYTRSCNYHKVNFEALFDDNYYNSFPNVGWLALKHRQEIIVKHKVHGHKQVLIAYRNPQEEGIGHKETGDIYFRNPEMPFDKIRTLSFISKHFELQE